MHRLDRICGNKPAKLLDSKSLTLRCGSSRFGPVYLFFTAAYLPNAPIPAYSGGVRTPLWRALGVGLATRRDRRLSRCSCLAVGLLTAACCLSAQSAVTVADHILWEREFANLSAETAVADHDGNLWIVSQYRGANRLVCIKPNGEMCANTALFGTRSLRWRLGRPGVP